MGKKRRVWWIVGSVVAAFALFAAIAFYIDYNSTDARIERAVAQIVVEHGLEPQSPGMVADRYSPGEDDIVFTGPPMDAEDASESVAILLGVFSRQAHVIVTQTRDDAKTEIHSFGEYSPSELSPIRVQLIPNDQRINLPLHFEPEAALIVYTYNRPSLWQRIKGLWPW